MGQLYGWFLCKLLVVSESSSAGYISAVVGLRRLADVFLLDPKGLLREYRRVVPNVGMDLLLKAWLTLHLA